ncbi:hypothetical protein ACIBO5_23920 [Nonomuraea angiospora]|nr:hypothetical protein [Nonomuraea angiospora]MDX3111091.1 hypothetical protein [Nonomuraea angiospora]
MEIGKCPSARATRDLDDENTDQWGALERVTRELEDLIESEEN